MLIAKLFHFFFEIGNSWMISFSSINIWAIYTNSKEKNIERTRRITNFLFSQAVVSRVINENSQTRKVTACISKVSSSKRNCFCESIEFLKRGPFSFVSR